MRRLEGRVALVTGASHGIGAAIAEALAREGARVTITYRNNPTGAEAVLRGIRLKDGVAQMLYADLRDHASVAEVVCSSTENFGVVDTLVVNGAVNRRSPFLETDDAALRDVLHSNLLMPFFLVQSVARNLILANRPGSIITVSSIRGAAPQSGRSAYCISKAGLDMLTRSAALELARYGVRVNGIAAGITAEGMNSGLAAIEPEAWNRRISALPLGRVGAGSDIAETAVFLASDEAAWITGSIITVDGGGSLVSI